MNVFGGVRHVSPRTRNEVRVTSAGLKRDPGVSRGPQGGLQFVTVKDPWLSEADEKRRGLQVNNQ